MQAGPEKRRFVNSPEPPEIRPPPGLAKAKTDEKNAYEAGYSRGYLQAVRDVALNGGEKVIGNERLWRLMSTPAHRMREEERSISTVQGKWQGADCFVVCGGSSLQDFDFKLLRAHKVIMVNRVPLHIKECPPPDFLVVNDLSVWQHYEGHPLADEESDGKPTHKTILVSQPSAFFEYKIKKGLWYYPSDDVDKLSVEPNTLYMHTTVATVAISLAWLLGAKRVFLLGLDGYVTHDRSYFWDEKRKHETLLTTNQNILIDKKMLRWEVDMKKLADYFEQYSKIEVLNLSAQSQITVWPRAWLKDVLPDG